MGGVAVPEHILRRGEKVKAEINSGVRYLRKLTHAPGYYCTYIGLRWRLMRYPDGSYEVMSHESYSRLLADLKKRKRNNGG